MTIDWNTEASKAKITAAIGRGLVRAAEAIKTEAVRLILEGSKSGIIYIRRGVSHQASAPGEAPASDTGRLVGSIDTEYDLSNNIARITASAEYAAPLEFGTLHMAPRPFMRPALDNKREEVVTIIAGEISEEMS